jgi:hypothetical protein
MPGRSDDRDKADSASERLTVEFRFDIAHVVRAGNQCFRQVKEKANKRRGSLSAVKIHMMRHQAF